jgi:hypothetical protein
VAYVSDAFGRTVASGWGSAPTGGAYRTDGAASVYAVNGSAGTMDLATGQIGVATLGAVGARDVLTAFRVRLDRLPGASGGYAYVSLRGSGSASIDDEYRLKVRVASTGDVFVHGTRVVDGAESDLGGEVATGTRVAAGGWLRVRARVQGTTSTELVVRAWAEGAAEPTTWHYRATDATSFLADAGYAGLRAYVSSRSTNGTVRFTFDDWTVSAP